MRKNTDNPKMKSLNPLKKLLSSYYPHFLKKIFPIDGSHYCLAKFCWKTFLIINKVSVRTKYNL